MRPKPVVILELHNKKTHRAKQIVEADAIYAVLYDGKPINYKDINPYLSEPDPKYSRTCFNTKGIALSLARKLNVLFKTDKFSAYKMTAVEQLTE
jgi:hypothetical protein